jgi:hypothetical protein
MKYCSSQLYMTYFALLNGIKVCELLVVLLTCYVDIF